MDASIEVYDDTTGEGLELARITVWEPGARLAWSSSLDDVEIDIRFEKTEVGTDVRLVATIPDGGADRGGTSWIGMTPVWFGSWVTERDQHARQPLRLARLAIAVHYARPGAAARWLRDVFGLEPAGIVPDDEPVGEHTWIEFHVGNCSLMVFGRDGDRAVEDSGDTIAAATTVTHTPWVFVDDLDDHCARVEAGGARIITPIWHHGARAYEVADLEGNHWTFAQASPLMR